MSSTNRTIALRFFEHLYAGRLDDALALLAPEAQYTVMGRSDDFPLAGKYDKGQIADLLGLISRSVPDGANPTITSTIAEGGAVAVIGHVEAIAASGRNYANNFVFLVTLLQGRITRVNEYIDTQHANDVLFSK
ncbi:nuclear transport factor 2 family protein [Streptomyces sp. NPDC057757]|uniref:nuclear transport factor 2 family protein n=1 Tax=Streptomyces sp. NPDC057757 TaxID=3346241 RepID=UPI00369F2FAF